MRMARESVSQKHNYSNGNLLSEREYKKDEIETKYYNEKGEIGLEVILEKQKEYMQCFYEVKSAICKNGKVLTKEEQKDIVGMSNIFSDFSHICHSESDAIWISRLFDRPITSQEVWCNKHNYTIYDKYPDVCGE